MTYTPHFTTPSAAGVNIHLDGAEWAEKMLVELEFSIRRRVVSAATRAGGAVILKAARAAAPVRTGLLRKQLRQTIKMYRDTGKVYGYVKVGATKAQRTKGTKNAGKYAHLVIAGTKPHSIEKGRDGAMLKLPGGFYTRLEHPGARPRPFLAEVANANFSEAIRAFERKLDERILVEQSKLRAKRAATAIAGG